MGCYDELGGVQIKCGGCDMVCFKIGDKVDVTDGIYVGYEGAAVVKDNVLVAVFPTLTDKWGGDIDPSDVLEGRNPIMNQAKEILKERGVDLDAESEKRT